MRQVVHSEHVDFASAPFYATPGDSAAEALAAAFAAASIGAPPLFDPAVTLRLFCRRTEAAYDSAPWTTLDSFALKQHERVLCLREMQLKVRLMSQGLTIRALEQCFSSCLSRARVLRST
jgi:hypothetical protein